MTDDLKAWYRESLTGKIEALRAALDRGEFETIRRISHQLKGSGGTYGFPEITEAAGKVERAESPSGESVQDLIDLLRSITGKEDESPSVILVIDDDDSVARAGQEMLSMEGRRILHASRGAEAMEILEREEPSLILLDLVLPDMDGRNLLVKLREMTAISHIPIIVITALAEPLVRMECLALGADEIINKPIDGNVLAAAVSSRLLRTADLVREAHHDPLTGLMNRAAFREHYGRIVPLMLRDEKPVTFGILDLDDFKSVNDIHGHKTGDEVLRIFSSILAKSLRASDILARWGGEEFAVLLPGSDPAGAAAALEKSSEAVKSKVFKGRDGGSFSVSFSAGLSAVEKGLPFDEVYASADRFLYAAKSSGKSRITYRDSDLPDTGLTIAMAEDDPMVAKIITHRLEREGFNYFHASKGPDLLEYIKDNPVSLFILDIMMPEMNGFEVLARIREHPSHRRTPIIFLTSMGNEEDIVRGLELGANDYMVKPFSPLELLARIRRLLK